MQNHLSLSLYKQKPAHIFTAITAAQVKSRMRGIRDFMDQTQKGTITKCANIPVNDQESSL